MADFEHEQLKSLFEKLAERLDKTAGDEEHLAMLTSLRASIGRLQKDLNKPQGARRGAGNDHTVLQEFMKDWQGTLKDFEGVGSKGARGAAPGKGTLLQEYANSLGDQTKASKRASEKTENLSKAFSKAKDSLIGFDTGLNGSVASLAGMMGLNQGAAGKMFGAIDDNMEMYRNLRQSGESSIDSIYGMRGAAQEFGMTTKQFSEAIAKGSDGARQLGAINFGDIQNKFRKANTAVGLFGLSIEQMHTVQSNYVQMLRDQGDLSTFDNGAIADGMKGLLQSSNITASILGKNREDILKERENVAQDANFQTYLKTLPEDQANALREAATYIGSSMGPEFAQMFKEQAMTNGSVVTQQSGQLAAVDGGNAQLMSGMLAQIRQTGEFNQENFATQQRDIANSRSDMQRRQFAIMGAMGGDLSNVLTASNRANLAGTQVQPEKANDGTETDVAANTMSALAESTSRLNAQFQRMIDQIMEPILTGIGPRLVSFLNGTTSMLAKLGESGWGLAAAVGVAIGGFALLKVGMGLFHAFMMKQVIGGLGRWLGSIFRGAGGRGAGAIGGRLLGGVAGRGALAGAGGLVSGGLGAAALAGGGILAGGAGLFMGNRMVAGNAGESLMGNQEGEGGFLSSRAAGYGTSAASGALAGAAIGSIVPVLGTAIGAAIGGVVGLGAAGVQDYMSNRNRPENRVSPENRSRNPQRVVNGQNPQNEAAASAGPRTNRTTPEMINQRIATLTEAGNSHLRAIMENNRMQLEAMRQEMAEARNFYAASLRLNEETIRTLRQLDSVN